MASIEEPPLYAGKKDNKYVSRISKISQSLEADPQIWEFLEWKRKRTFDGFGGIGTV
jgi:hypothetical protein